MKKSLKLDHESLAPETPGQNQRGRRRSHHDWRLSKRSYRRKVQDDVADVLVQDDGFRFGADLRAGPGDPVGSAGTSRPQGTVQVLVAPEATLMTDELPLYKKLGKEFASHETVNHSEGEYTRGRAHTNTAEGVFSLLKRGIMGTFHDVSKGHLHRYCDEFEFRHNTRIKLGVDDGERAAKIVLGAEGKRLTYQKRPAAGAA